MANYTVPDGLAAMLTVEDTTWNEVWRLIERAARKGVPVAFSFNVTEYAYDPDCSLVTVGGLTGDDGEIRAPVDDFAHVFGPLLRGGLNDA
ncbi:MAG: hypothetical protein ACU0GG_02560 [Paracoccaceae bacterium]